MWGGATPLSDYVGTCSNGLATLDPSNSRVLRVRLPCEGTLASGEDWTATSCSGDNLLRLAAASDKWVLGGCYS